MKCTRSGRLEKYPPGSESREGPGEERVLFLNFAWMLPVLAGLVCAVLLGYIGFILATVLSVIVLFVFGVTTAIGIRNLPIGYLIIEVEDQ